MTIKGLVRRMGCLLLVVAALVPVAMVNAMTVEVRGDSVFATGPVEDDYLKLKDALAKPGVARVVFVNSPGGDLWTGMQIGRMIADQKLDTVIAGYCVSSCSIMFMGGKERTFSDAFRPLLTNIGIHGPHRKDTKSVAPELAGQMYAFYKLRMGERFNAEVINKALFDMDDSGAMLRVFDTQRLPKRVTYHCKSVQTARRDCTEIAAQDAWTLGVVTSNELTRVELPDAFKEVPKIGGKELTLALSEPAVFFKDLANRQCTADVCRKLITDYQNAREHKGLALPAAGAGVGTASNRDTLSNAFLGAVYACNHLKDRPARLCEIQLVDGYDLRASMAQNRVMGVEALKQLVPPPEKFYGDEEFGGGFTSAVALRTQKMTDTTPRQQEGVVTYGTQELVVALKTPTPPTLIDVVGFDASIPGALVLAYGGAALDDSAKDALLEDRFAGLLKLLSPDPTKPVVFFARGRDDWQAVNAAIRARKLGYTQVGRYRGGITSWLAANLPTAPVVIQAVVN